DHGERESKRRKREREHEGEKVQKEAVQEEEAVQKGTPLIFLAHLQKQEVGRWGGQGIQAHLQQRDGRSDG
ncbi:hypothetical protein CRENBAI_007539, partial [Crenichthys baileyi]